MGRIDEIVMEEVNNLINEIAGANMDAIKIANTLIRKLEKEGMTKDSFTIPAPYSEKPITVYVCDNWPYSNNSVGVYIHSNREISIKRDMIGKENWKTKLKGILLHELTHNIQRDAEPFKKFCKRKRYFTDKAEGKGFHGDVKYYFEDDEMNAFIAESYFYFSENIKGVDIKTIRSKDFKEKIFEESGINGHLNLMNLLIKYVTVIPPTDENLKEIYNIGISVNNKVHDRTVNRMNTINLHNGKMVNINRNINDISKEKNLLKKLMYFFSGKKRKLSKEYNRQTALVDKEIELMKNTIIRIMKEKYIGMKASFDKMWNYVVADYINNGGYFTSDAYDVYER